MNFQDWIGKRSHIGRECREGRIQDLTDKYWQAKVDLDFDRADELKKELNDKYDTVVLENTGDEVERLIELFRNARMSGQHELASQIHKLLNDKHDIAIFT